MVKPKHEYVATLVGCDMETGVEIRNINLPPILKYIRDKEGCKTMHGNRVRTKILEEGMCIIFARHEDGTLSQYDITVERWIET